MAARCSSLERGNWCIVDDVAVRTFSKNEFFGEIALMKREKVRRSASIRAKTYSSSSFLRRSTHVLGTISKRRKNCVPRYSISSSQYEGGGGDSTEVNALPLRKPSKNHLRREQSMIKNATTLHQKRPSRRDSGKWQDKVKPMAGNRDTMIDEASAKWKVPREEIDSFVSEIAAIRG